MEKEDSMPTLKITMEQRGCYIEVVVPEIALPTPLQMQEYMRNTGADMYARLWYMMQKAQKAQVGDDQGEQQ